MRATIQQRDRFAILATEHDDAFAADVTRQRLLTELVRERDYIPRVARITLIGVAETVLLRFHPTLP